MPQPGRGQILIRTTRSLVSMGTERMLVEFGKANLLQKARQQPDKVKQVLDKMKTDGLMPTLDAVFKRLDEPLPLGYCNVGVVADERVLAGVAVGHPNQFDEAKMPKASGFAVGDRVVSNGPHAEVVSVPRNLCAKIPDNVSDEQATFTVLGAIGLQGIRLANPTLGEKFVVFGAGLIGLLTVQLLRASGCEVLAVDLSDDRLTLAQSYGAEICNPGSGDAVAAALSWTEGVGVDGVIITASAKTDEIVHQAAEMCRKRGRIILVGVVGLNLRRSDFYEKELTFQVSCSYGPGRYDEPYEQQGQDYPLGFVRWTENRNFQAVLSMMATGRLDVSAMITHRVAFEEAGEAYKKITQDPAALGVILEYPYVVDLNRTTAIAPTNSRPAGTCTAAMIGAGNFAKMTMAPALSKTTARLKYVSARTNSAAAAYIAQKYGFENATTDLEAIWQDPGVNTVFITTQHNSHASLVQQALRAGKHVFVEKPLCLSVEDLQLIVEQVQKVSGAEAQGRPNDSSFSPQLMVGFNRRFSAHIQKVKSLLKGRSEPLAMNFTANAGIIPPNVWVHDPQKGGGRIIGEACHFIDLFVYLTGSRIISVAAFQMGKGVAVQEDKMSIILQFEDGSIGNVDYFANGSKQYPKETLEIFSEGRVVRMENFRRTTGYGFKGFRKFGTFRQNKGHAEEFASFVERVSQGGPPLIPLPELINVTLASFAAVTAAKENRVIQLDAEYGRYFAV